MKPFQGNPYPTLGVEQEFQLLDPETGDLIDGFEAVRAALDEPTRRLTSDELFRCILETQSGVHETVDTLAAEVADQRRRLVQACQRAGAALAAAGTHPFADWRRQRVAASDHYAWVLETCGYAARRMLSFGLHIHVGMRSAETALYALHEMQRWAGVLLALAANSPFHEGEDTRFDSVRSYIFGGMPRTGLPPAMETFDDLVRLYETLRATGEVLRPGDLWWALRPQPPLGTLELRLFDLPTGVGRLAEIAALSQAAGAYYQQRCQAGRQRTGLNQTYLRQNLWQGARYGLEGVMADAATGEAVPARVMLTRLIETVAPEAQRWGGAAYLERLVGGGPISNEAAAQRRWLADHGGDCQALALEVARRTAAQEEWT